jgi:hypothetical protein
LRPAVIRQVAAGGFADAMRASGRLGGQNKPPRLANARTFASLLP